MGARCCERVLRGVSCGTATGSIVQYARPFCNKLRSTAFILDKCETYHSPTACLAKHKHHPPRYSQVGFGSLGWVVGGAGGVPPFYEPAAEGSSWNHIYADTPRNFSNIDYLFVLHATNDGLRGGTPAAVATSVQGWLKDVRKACGPKTDIFLVVPFGNFGGKNAPVGALKSGYDAYQQMQVTDSKTHFIDLGRDAAIGLECGAWEHGCVGYYGSRAGPSIQGCDGIHPRGGTQGSARHGELASMLVAQASVLLGMGPPS